MINFIILLSISRVLRNSVHSGRYFVLVDESQDKILDRFRSTE